MTPRHLPFPPHKMKYKLFRNQSYSQTRASTIFGIRELQNGSSTRPPMLKANFKATVDTGMANILRAIDARIRYLKELTFHQFNTLKDLFLQSSHSSPKYLSNSFLFSTFSWPICCFVYNESMKFATSSTVLTSISHVS